ncbi:MAG: glycosyltransferase family 2 protein [Desulfurococcaceae archaeon]
MIEYRIPIIIPVYNTTPETLYLTIYHLNKTTKNPIIVVNDGSRRRETIVVLKYISRRGLAEVLDKENGGKIDALLYGLNYVKEKYGSKCVIIQDDDILISAKDGNLDEILRKHCEELDNDYPVYVYPVENRIYVLNSIIDDEIVEDLKDLEKVIKGINPTYEVEIKTKPNLLDDLQNLEHVVSTLIARRIAREGLWVNGSASLWKSSELERYLKQHSKDHYADDLELTLLLRRDGKGIRFSDEIILYPELISKFKAYVKQRVKWGHGVYRVFFKYPKEFLKNPLYFAYTISPFILYSVILAPENLKHYISLTYFSILILQSIYYSKKFSLNERFSKKFKNINKLLGAIYIVSTTLLLSLISKTYYNDYRISSIIESLGLLGATGYFLYIFNKYGKDRGYVNLKNLLLKYIPYIIIYCITTLPLGLIDYLDKEIKNKKETYKLSNK